MLTEINLHTTLEKTAQNPKDLFPFHAQLSGHSKPPRDILRIRHLTGHDLLKETELGTLRNTMADGKLDHVVTTAKGDHIVIHARAGDLSRILEMELFRLEILLVERHGSQRDGRASCR